MNSVAVRRETKCRRDYGGDHISDGACNAMRYDAMAQSQRRIGLTLGLGKRSIEWCAMFAVDSGGKMQCALD